MSGGLFGSAPSVKQLPPQSLTSPEQQGFLQAAGDYLQSGQPAPGVQPYGGPFVAPQTAAQTGAVNQLGQITSGVGTGTGGVGSDIPQASSNTLLSLLGWMPPAAQAGSFDASTLGPAPQQDTGYQAPQIDTSGFTAQTVDPAASRAAFQQGVVAPLTSNFEQTVLPSLKGAGGASAGGIYSSDTSRGSQLAASNLDQTLAGAGSQYELATQTANQQARIQNQQLVAGLAQGNQQAKLTTNALLQAARAGNQTAKLQLQQIQAQTGLTDAQLAQQASEYNVGAQLGGAASKLGAVQAAPGVETQPYVQPAAAASLLEGAFPTISTPQTTAQVDVQGRLQDFYNQIQQTLSRLGLAIGGGTATTQQPQTVVTPGQTGLIPSLAGGLAGNTGLGAAAGSALFGGGGGGGTLSSLLGSGMFSALPFFSDRRLKTDVVRLGRNERLDLPVYRFRYKTDPEGVQRVGYMADEVESKYPWAAAEDQDGIKYVSYGALALAEAFPAAA